MLGLVQLHFQQGAVDTEAERHIVAGSGLAALNITAVYKY